MTALSETTPKIIIKKKKEKYNLNKGLFQKIYF